MSYLVSLPDGRNVEFPDSVPRDKAAEIIRQQLGGPKAAPSAPSSLGDIATAFGLGAVGSTKALTDVAGADNAASRALGDVSESLSRAYTPQRQAEIERRQQLIKEAEKSGSTWEEIKANLGSVAEAPLQTAAQGLGSIVPFALTGGAGSAFKLLPTTVKTINTLMGAAAGAGAVKGSIYDAVHDRLIQEGQPEEVARQQAIAAQEYLGKNAGQIALGTGIGAVAGRYGVESLLAPGAAKAAEAQMGRRVGTALVGEMPLEGLQGSQERAAANIALQNQGYNVPTFEGVVGQGVQEASMAGLAAGPVAAVRSPAAEIQRQKDEEDKKLREERRLAEATELARKQTPEYAFEIEQKYLALEKQRNDLKAQRIKIDENSPTVAADRAFNKDLDKQIEELGRNEIAPLAKEYNTVKPLLNQIKEQKRLAEQKRVQGIEIEAAKTPQETQQQQYFQSPQAALPGFENVEQPTPAPAYDKQAKALELAQQHKEIHGLLDDNQQAQSDAIARDDYDALDKALEQRGMLQTELNKIQELLKETGHPIFQEQEAQRVSAKLEKAKAELKNMAGEALDPAKVLKKRAQIKELEAELQGYGGVQEVLKPADAEDKRQLFVPTGGKSESRQAFSQRTYTPDRYRLGAEEQEQDVVEQQRLSEEEARADAERARRIAPEVNALRRISQGPALGANVGEGQISGNVDKLVDALLLSTMPATGRVVSGTTSTRPNEADVLRGQLQYARVTNNRALIAQLKERMAQLNVAENEVEGGLDTGLTAKEVGVEGRLSPQAREANRIARIAQSQMATYDRLADFMQYVRENDQNIPDARKQTLRNAAEKLKDTAIGLALNEAQARRKQAGVSPMSTAEQTKLVGELESIMTELIERGAGMFEPTQIVGKKAQMRANKIVMGATEEERRAPLGRRVFNNFEAAAQALREQMRDAINVQPETAERKPLTPPRKVSEPLRTQFSGQQRSVDEQFEAAYARSTDAEYETLRDIRSKFMSLTPEAQDIALEQVRRVETGRGLDMPRQLTDQLEDLRQARVSDGDQNELFPGASEKSVTRTTSKRFINFLDSKEVFKLREEIAEQNRQAEFQAKRAASIAAKVEEEAKKAAEFLQKVEAAKNKSPIEKAQAALVKISSEDSQVQIAIKTADAIKRQRLIVRQRINVMVEQVQTARNKAEKHLKEVQESFDYIAKQYLLKPKNVKFSVGLDYWEKELVKAEQQYASADKALNAAKATQLRVTEDHASDTLNNALINEGEKAERELQRAKDAVLKAKSDEIKAQNELERVRLEVTKEPRAPYIGEMLERTTGDKALRYVRDTSEQGVQRAVKAMRGIIAKEEVAYDSVLAKSRAEQTAAVKDGDTKKAAQIASAGQEEAKKIADRIENHYAKINDILNNAPVKLEQRMTAAEAKALQEFEDAQAMLLDAMNAEFRKKAGLPAPKLSRRKVEGVIKTNRGAVRTAIKEPSVAQQEREAKAAAEGPTPALEKIAEARAEEARLQAQIDYIADNPSKTTEGRAKQRAALADAVAKRTAVRAELKELAKEQAAVVAQAKQAKQETKQVRTKGKEFTRADTQAAKALEDVYSGGDMASETTTAQQVQLSENAKEALRDGRLLDALDDVAATSKLAFIRENAAALRDLVARTRVIVTDDIEVDGKQAPAAYNSTQNAILIKPDALTEANLIHEATHAATMRALEGPVEKLNADQVAAKQELQKMFDDLTADGTLSGEYASNNVKEFASEVQSNANLREKLDNRSLLRRFFDAALRLIGMKPAATRTEEAQALIERLYMQSGKLAAKTAPAGTAVYANEEMANVGALVDKFVAKNKSRTEKLRAAAGGWLGLETQLVDRFAGFERLSKTMDALKGSQMMYYLRMYDQRMNFVSQAVSNGALKIVDKKRADGKTEHVIESTPGASIKGVVDILKDAKPYVGNGEAVNRLFTMYMSGIRAANKGFQSLNFGADVSERDLKAAMDAVNGNKELKAIFDDARREYNEYNRDMIDFVASTGAISEQTRKELTQENDYIPWYRESNGVAELMIGGASPIRIGSIAEQPYLHELVGGDRPILDFMTSSVQNTNMLADMGLRNLATKNAVFELVDMDMAKIVGAQTGSNIVKFKVDGQDKYASIETDSAGIPGDLIVKGMEGIPTQMPAIFRIMSIPSRLLRKGVTLSPLYAAKQLFRDSLAAPILTGANFSPVAGALRQINKPTKEILERRGIVGGQIFTGTNEDLSKVLRGITDGKTGWLNALAKAEAIGMEADALTRRAQYQSYLDQGLSEMEATLMALESMNFNKRGADPSIHIIGAMIPFFNAQIQGLNVLYKAMTGRMPFNERLKIQEKMLKRGGMLAAGTLAYAAMMQDDEAYKNATPEQKYGNWFVRIPGVAEPVRIPVPFEVGYIFKALPEALYNSMVDEHGGEEAVKAFKQILLQTIPGGTSYGIPQALKPAIEAGLGKSFYTGRDILSAHEKSLLPEEQFRVNTSEAAKLIGKGLGVSPILLEQLVQGYTGPMGLAMLQAVSLGIPRGNTPEQATKRLSELPLVGGAFQPNDAGGIINATYDRFEDSIKIQRTVDKLFEEGRQAEAKELLQKTGNEYAAGEVGDFFATQMKELTQYERAIQAMAITPAEKRQRLDEIKKMKIALAASARQTVEKIAPR